MKAHEILQRLPAENAAEIFEYLYAKEKPAYRLVFRCWRPGGKLRPVVLERKSRPERHFWMISELVRKANDDAATEVLQTWLLGNHREMVCSFPRQPRSSTRSRPARYSPGRARGEASSRGRGSHSRQASPPRGHRLSSPLLQYGHCGLADSKENYQRKFPPVPRHRNA